MISLATLHNLDWRGINLYIYLKYLTENLVLVLNKK